MEDFHPTSGRITGVVGLAACTAVVGYGLLVDGFPVVGIWVALLVGVLVWAAMLRPRVTATASHLVLRNMITTVALPLAAVEQVVVTQVLAVRVGEKRYVSPAIGKSWRQAAKTGRGTLKATSETSYPVFVEERISQLARDAREREGLALLSEEQHARASDVRRDWAWPEAGALVVASVGLLLAILL